MQSFTAKVVSGHGRGKTLGFPTLNFAVPKRSALEPGSYACRLEVQSEKSICLVGPLRRPPRIDRVETGIEASRREVQNFSGVLFFGTRQTFNSIEPTLEIHLFDYFGEPKIAEAKIKVLNKIREPQKFESQKKLITAIEKDCEQALKFFQKL